MELSKIMHIASVVVGIAGVIAFASAIFGGIDNLVFGVTKFDALFCSAVLVLIAIWVQLSATYHATLEKSGDECEKNKNKHNECCH